MKKIMFNDRFNLTKLVIEGRKTMTRRIIDCSKNKVFLDLLGDENYMKYDGTLSYDYEDDVLRIDDDFDYCILKPHYKIGEKVAIAQSYDSFYDDTHNPVLFPSGIGWTNKMFVRADLMPHNIKITDVRIERLQDISGEDCLKEGITEVSGEFEAHTVLQDGYYGERIKVIKRYYGIEYYELGESPREAYGTLIDKISGKGAWESNPWVLAYEFELIK